MFDACPSAEDRSFPVETRAERRMRRLSRMADIGLSIAEKLERQAELAAVHAEVDAVPDNLPHSKRLDEIGRSFAQVSRAVSLATALEDRIDRGLPALPDDDRAVREREAREKRAEVAWAVASAIDADPTVRSRRRIVQLRLNLDRLLDAELADLDRFLRRPFPEIEARLRRDLGLDVDDDDLTGSAGVPPASRAGSPRSGWFGETTASPPPRSRRGGGGDERQPAQRAGCDRQRFGDRREERLSKAEAGRSGGGGRTTGAPGMSDQPSPVAETPNPRPAPASLHHHSAVPLPHSSAEGEEKTLPP